MLLGRIQRWVSDYRREPFLILLESKSSLYTDDKLTNSVGMQLQNEIWNFNMFLRSDVNLKIFLQDERIGVYTHFHLIYTENVFGKSHTVQSFWFVTLGKLPKAFVWPPGWEEESLPSISTISHLVKYRSAHIHWDLLYARHFIRNFSDIFSFTPIILMPGTVISINVRKHTSQWRRWDVSLVQYH